MLPRRLSLAALAVLGVLLAWTCGPDGPREAAPQGDRDDGGGRAAERPPPFFRLEPLAVREPAASVSLEATYDTQPSLARDASGRPWLAWVGHDFEGRDRIWTSAGTATGWTDPGALTESDGEYLRPVLAPVGGDRMACAWTATGEATGIWLSLHDGEAWSEPVRATPVGDHALNPELAPDGRGGLWMVWQVARPGGFELLAAHRKAESTGFGDPVVLTERVGAHWDPALAVDPQQQGQQGMGGRVAVVWSRFEGGDYDLFAVELEAGAQELSASAPVRLTGGGAYDMHPDAAFGPDGRLWVVWDRMQLTDHGRSGNLETTDSGAVLNAGIGTGGRAQLGVLCLADGALGTTAMLPPGPPRTHRVENAAYPRIAVAGDGALWVAYRAWGVKLGAPHSYWWDAVVMSCTAEGWSRPEVLAGTDGNLEEPALLVDADGALVAAAMEHRATAMPGNPHPEDGPRSYAFDHHWNLAPQGDSGEIAVARLGPAAGHEGAPEVGALAAPSGTPDDSGAWTERVEAAIELDGERYQLFFGDTHRHSNISRCTAGADATVGDHHRYARDVMRLDFVVVSDHSGQTSDFNWWTLCKSAELYNVPGDLTTLFGYEISNAYPTGHKNLVFAERPTVPLRLALDDVANGPDLWARLEERGARAITIPHTSAMPAGTDWEDYDGRYERLVEIFQARTGSSEHAGAPRLAHSSVNELGFVHRALEKGHRLGFIASTDHGNGASYACVYATGDSREALYEALHARRCYGATAYGIQLDVRADGRLMGSEYEAEGPARLTVRAAVPPELGPLARAVVFAGTEPARIEALDGGSASFEWTDPSPPTDGDRPYYVRLELESGELAWSSPIWVRY